MKKIRVYTVIYIFLLFSLPLTTISQLRSDNITSNIDSLETILTKAKGEERVKVLNALINEYSIIDSVKSFNYFKESISLSEKLNFHFHEKNTFVGLISLLVRNNKYDEAISRIKKVLEYCEKNKLKKAVGFSYSEIGYVFLKMNNYAEAEKYQNIALKKFSEIDYEYGIATAYERIGIINMIKNEFTEALKYYYLALKINQRLDFIPETGTSLYHIGLTELYLSNYEEAVDCILRSLKYWEKNNYLANIWNCNELIGNIYIKLGGYRKALHYHKIALKIREDYIRWCIRNGKGSGDDADSVNNLGIAYSYNNIAEVYLNLKKYDSAYFYAYESLKKKESEKSVASPNDIANSQLNLGNIYCKLNKYDSALLFIQKAASTYEKLQNKSSYAEALYGLGQVYFDIRKYNKAKENYIKALKITKEIGDKNNEKIGYKLLSDLFLLKDNYKKSLKYFKHYTNLKDSIINKESKSKIEELQIKHNVDKKEQEIKTQKALVLKRKNQLILSFIIGGLLILVAVTFIYFIQKTKRQKEKILHQENENLQKRLELKNKELVCNVSSIYVKNQVISKVAKQLSKSSDNFKQTNMGMIRDVIGELKQNLDETSWKEFEIRFAKVHESFYKNLDNKFSDLTNTERKICAMLKLGMSSKEIASITMIQSESVDITRSRLRKKLNLTREENLTRFLNKL